MDLACFKHFKINSNMSCLLKLFVIDFIAYQKDSSLNMSELSFVDSYHVALLNCFSWILLVLQHRDRERNLLHTTLESKALPRQDTFWG